MQVSSAANKVGTVANGIAEAGGATPSYNPSVWWKGTGGGGGGFTPNMTPTPATMPAETPAAAGGGNAADAFEQYKRLAGFAPALEALQKGVTGGAAAQGLLNSGATQKALLREGSKLDSQLFNNYLQQLAGLSGIGLQGGQLISNAGQVSTNTGGSPSTLGSIASAVGGIASIFSDRRMKRDIVKIDEMKDGLGIYTFRYFDEPTARIGVMADEVETLRPWALGPDVGGYKTVHYERL